jgi:Fe-S cluster assembly scaffold protein SufB
VNPRPQALETIYRQARLDPSPLHDPLAAHLVVDHNRVLTSRLVDGFQAEVQERPDGIQLQIDVAENTRLERPVHICFGMTPTEGIQRVQMLTHLRPGAEVSFQAHCAFPFALGIEHVMEAEIQVDEGARYSYLERHVHGPEGGVLVLPRARIRLGPRARLRTEFELLRGRVGEIRIDYETTCGPDSILEMDARINGTGEDRIEVHETAHLAGERARGVLTSRIAVRDRARAEVFNKLTATAAGAVGHVDCKEIVQGEAVASAVPIVEVAHPQAHVTHEAAIGSVDHKQLETLLARGLDEEAATELIIQGMLA